MKAPVLKLCVALGATASVAAPNLLAEPEKDDEALAAPAKESVQLTIVTASGGG